CPNHPCINILPARSMKDRILSGKKSDNRPADKFFNRIHVLFAGKVAFFASAPLACPAEPVCLGNSPFELAIPPVDEDGPNLDLDAILREVEDCHKIRMFRV